MNGSPYAWTTTFRGPLSDVIESTIRALAYRGAMVTMDDIGAFRVFLPPEETGGRHRNIASLYPEETDSARTCVTATWFLEHKEDAQYLTGLLRDAQNGGGHQPGPHMLDPQNHKE